MTTLLLPPQEAYKLINNSGAVLIDVRDADEYRSIRIPGAQLQPLTALPYLPEDLNKEAPAIYFCRSGNRTGKAEELLKARGHSQIYILDGGILAWKKAGLPIAETPGPFPIMRQVHVAAGSLVLAFSLLAQIRPGFSLVTALIGAGLLYSGLTGTCGMAMLLQHMPWNKKS